VLIIPSSWGSQLDGDLHQHTVPLQDSFLVLLPGKKKTSAREVSHAHPLLCFKFCFTLFLLASFYQKTQKISFLYSCFYLLTFSFVGKEQKFMYIPKVSVPKPHHIFKIGKTFSSTRSDLQVESSSETSKVPSVVSGDLEEIVDLNASFENT
jgi:hypothetical protein